MASEFSNFCISFWGWLKSPGRKKIPVIYFLSFFFFVQETKKTHGIATVKLDIEHSLQGVRIWFQVFDQSSFFHEFYLRISLYSIHKNHIKK